MPWIWRRCLARRASASVERREPEVSASATIGFRNDGEAEPMVSPLIGTCPKNLRGKAFRFGIFGPCGLRQNPGVRLVFQWKLAVAIRRGPGCRQDGTRGAQVLPWSPSLGMIRLWRWVKAIE